MLRCSCGPQPKAPLTALTLSRMIVDDPWERLSVGASRSGERDAERLNTRSTVAALRVANSSPPG
jgi:hypothetical protein